jgi:hypothetical protein
LDYDLLSFLIKNFSEPPGLLIRSQVLFDKKDFERFLPISWTIPIKILSNPIQNHEYAPPSTTGIPLQNETPLPNIHHEFLRRLADESRMVVFVAFTFFIAVDMYLNRGITLGIPIYVETLALQILYSVGVTAAR